MKTKLTFLLTLTLLFLFSGSVYGDDFQDAAEVDQAEIEIRWCYSKPGSCDSRQLEEKRKKLEAAKERQQQAQAEKELTPQPPKPVVQQPLERKKIQEQLNYEKRMAEAAERKKEEARDFQNLMQAFDRAAEPPSSNSLPMPYFGSNRSSNEPSGYSSSTGRTYQYDLSDPRQRALYGADPRAKLRDRIEPDVLRRNDRNMGKYGGGILKNNNNRELKFW